MSNSLNVLTLDSAIEEAVQNAMIAVEKGDFYKTIELLEYVREYKAYYDEVMVNYVLLISYYNINDYQKIVEQFKVLETIQIPSGPIKDVLESIGNEFQKRNAVEEGRSNALIKAIFGDVTNVKLLAEVYPDDDFLSLICEPLSKEDYIDISRLIEDSERGYDFFEKNIDVFVGFNKNVSPMGLLNGLRDVADNIFFLTRLTTLQLEKFYKNDKIPKFYKNLLTTKLLILIKYQIMDSQKITQYTGIEGEKLYLNESKLDDLIEEVVTVYGGIKLDFEPIIIIVELFVFENFPNEIFDLDHNKLKAMLCYIANDVTLGRDLDELVQANTGVKFEEVKEEIKKYKQLTTFLISWLILWYNN